MLKSRCFYLACLLSACTPQKGPVDSATSEVVSGFTDDTFTPVECGKDGSFLMTMHLDPDGLEVSSKDIKLKMGNIPLGTSDFVEFYICGTPAGEAILKKIVLIRSMSIGAWTRPVDALIPEDDTHKAVLAEAIASQDYSKLEIKFINSKKKAPSYLLKGWKKSDGKSFLTLSAFDASKKNPLVVISGETFDDPNFRGFNAAIYGILKDGGARDRVQECKKNTRSKIFKSEKVDLKLDYCYYGNHAIYITYEFKDLSLLDKNTGDEILESGDSEILKVLTVETSHHSLLDKFIIKTANGSYTIESGKFSYSYLDAKLQGLSQKIDCEFVYKCGEDAPVVTHPTF